MTKCKISIILKMRSDAVIYLRESAAEVSAEEVLGWER